MFGGKRSTYIATLKAMYAERDRVDSLLEAEESDKVKAEVNVKHHESQIRFLAERKYALDAGITKLERIADECEEVKEAARSAKSRWRDSVWPLFGASRDKASAERQGRGEADPNYVHTFGEPGQSPVPGREEDAGQAG